MVYIRTTDLGRPYVCVGQLSKKSGMGRRPPVERTAQNGRQDKVNSGEDGRESPLRRPTILLSDGNGLYTDDRGLSLPIKPLALRG